MLYILPTSAKSNKNSATTLMDYSSKSIPIPNTKARKTIKTTSIGISMSSSTILGRRSKL